MFHFLLWVFINQEITYQVVKSMIFTTFSILIHLFLNIGTCHNINFFNSFKIFNYFFYFWYYNIVTSLPSYPFLPLSPSVHLFLISFKFIVSFFINCCYIHMCMNIYIHILNIMCSVCIMVLICMSFKCWSLDVGWWIRVPFPREDSFSTLSFP